MNYLSVCSGIEAASVAWQGLGWKPVMFSEIEPFPIAVLKHHYPDTPVHGDFTTLIDAPPLCDLLCGGTPCQAFSVAGLRESLADDRGNLTLQFVRLADAIDHLRSTHGLAPGWILWENVPGVLSTKDNAFGAFLGGLCGRSAPIPQPAGGWTDAGVVDGPARVAAWRTLDAQYFGLAQRRKRVFVLARGGAGRWACADALLPIIESSQWHPAPSRKKGEGVAATVSGSTPSRRNGGSDPTAGHFIADIAPTLPNQKSGGGGPRGDFHYDGGLIAHTLLGKSNSSHAADLDTYIAHTLRGEGFDASEDGTGRGIPLVMAHGQANAEVVSDGEPSLTCNHEAPVLVRMREGKEGGGKGPLVSEDQSLTLATANDQVLAYTLHGTPAKQAASETDLHAALRSRAPGGSEASTTTVIAVPMQEVNVSRANLKGTGTGIGKEGDPMFTLGAAQPHGVAFAQNQRDEVREMEVAGAVAEPGMKQTTYARIGMQVRRVTPKECERLQGFPDEYTLVQHRNKQAADGPRYKAIGNSWAVACARYIGEQIERVTDAEQQAA